MACFLWGDHVENINSGVYIYFVTTSQPLPPLLFFLRRRFLLPPLPRACFSSCIYRASAPPLFFSSGHHLDISRHINNLPYISASSRARLVFVRRCLLPPPFIPLLRTKSPFLFFANLCQAGVCGVITSEYLYIAIAVAAWFLWGRHVQHIYSDLLSSCYRTYSTTTSRSDCHRKCIMP